jgi:hypothetical protein
MDDEGPVVLIIAAHARISYVGAIAFLLVRCPARAAFSPGGLPELQQLTAWSGSASPVTLWS